MLYIKLVGAIIAGANENDRKAAESTVRGRDFNLSDLGSRQTLSAWLGDLMQKLQGDNSVPSTTSLAISHTECQQSLIRKIAKMISFVHDDVPNIISKNKKPFYGTGEGIGKNSDWLDFDDILLISALLKSKILCFNEYNPFNTNRPSRGPDQNLQWYQAVALGNGESVLADFHWKSFALADINDLLDDPRFCNLSGESTGHYHPIPVHSNVLSGEFGDEALPKLVQRLWSKLAPFRVKFQNANNTSAAAQSAAAAPEVNYELSAFEKLRNDNIKRNEDMLRQLGFESITEGSAVKHANMKVQPSRKVKISLEQQQQWRW